MTTAAEWDDFWNQEYHPRGFTFSPAHDEPRVTNLLERVYQIMRDRRFRTLEEIQAITGGSQAGISARLRDLRKGDATVNPFGPHEMVRERKGDPKRGLFQYKLGVKR